MSTELGVLGYYGLFVVVVIVLQVLAAIPQVGLAALATARDDLPPLTGVAGRMERALKNCVVALALFTAAVLVVHLGGKSSAGTVLAAQIFLIARIAYVAVYAAGTPWLRTGIWAVGLLATLYLFIAGLF